jgi:protein-tyrosine phosphatase
VIDLHFHLLPGIDDGPSDLDAAIELARAAARCGTTDVVATPHVNATWPNTPERIGAGVEALRRRLAEHEIPLRIHAGAEVALTWGMECSDDELAQLTLGGGPWLLVEPPHTSRVIGLDGLLVRLQHRGHRIILAHVERCPTFLAEREMLARLVDGGMLTSVTAGSLAGRFGGAVQRFTHDLLSAGLVHNVASDAHDVRGRPPGLSAELERAGLEEQRPWLTAELPRALLDGAPIPIAPAWPAAYQRRGLRALLRR